MQPFFLVGPANGSGIKKILPATLPTFGVQNSEFDWKLKVNRTLKLNSSSLTVKR
jgi:hypothetical protein